MDPLRKASARKQQKITPMAALSFGNSAVCCAGRPEALRPRLSTGLPFRVRSETRIAQSPKCRHLVTAQSYKKNAAWMPRRFKEQSLFDYLETDFLNMRSIFSLIASIAVEFACAVDRA